MFLAEKAKYCVLRGEKELRDNMSNCAACELDDKVELHLRRHNFDTAMTMGNDLFTKKLTCGHMPFTTYCTCVECFTDVNDMERANEFFLKAEEDLLATENDTSQVSNISKLIRFLRLHNREKAWEYFEQYVDWSHNCDDYHMFCFSKNVLPLLREGGQRTLQINPVMAWYRTDNMYNTEELYNYYLNKATDLVQRFDKRNENTYFNQQLSQVMA